MQEHRASLTARIVSWGRAITVKTAEDGRREILDPTAPTLLGDRGLTAALARWSLGNRFGSEALRLASLGFLDQMRTRTEAIDAMVSQACVDGIEQVVILGAGLDGRAWRLDALQNAHVFEVDHPATQATKTSRVQALTQRAAGVTFVAVNFERDSFGDKLRDAGYDPGRPTAWVWEGVTMYLLPQTTDATLSQMAALSAPDSRLAVTYSPTDSPLLRTQPARLIAQRVFEGIGEPLLGLTTTADFGARVKAAGWMVRDDDAMAGYAGIERLLIAGRLSL